MEQSDPNRTPQAWQQPSPQPASYPQPPASPLPASYPQPYPQPAQQAWQQPASQAWQQPASQPYPQPYPQPAPQAWQQPAPLPYPQPAPYPQAACLPPQPDPAREKKALRRDIRNVTLVIAAVVLTAQFVPLVIVMAMAAVFTVMHPELSRVSAPNSESELYLEAYDQVYSAFIENLGLISIVALSLAAVWCLLLRGRKLFTSDIRQRREGMSFAKLMPLVALIFAIQFVSMVLSGALDALLQLLGQDQGAVNDSSDVLSGMVGTIGGFLYISLIGPFLEEVIFRGAAMRKLERHGANFAIITTSVLFAFYHLNFQQAIFTFMAGIVFAYAAGRYSLKWAWVLHVINNMFASVLMLTMEFWPPLTTAFTMAAFLLFLAGLVFSIIYLATHASLLRAQKRAGAPNVKGVFKKAWTSPAFLLYVIIATGLCVLMLLP